MKKLIQLIILVTIVLAVSACTPKPEQIAPFVEQTLAAWPTQTGYPTLTPENTYTPYPTYTPVNTATVIIKIVTPTFTASPIFTPTNTLPPTNTPIPTATTDPLKADHHPGLYLIGVDIAPGVWRNNGTSDSCYWKITDKYGDIIRNFFGMGGGTAYVPITGYQVEFDKDCGTWTWLSD